MGFRRQASVRLCFSPEVRTIADSNVYGSLTMTEFQSHSCNRRFVLQAAAALAATISTRTVNGCSGGDSGIENAVRPSRGLGLLLGGLVGDALGGPIEFSDKADSLDQLCHARSWGEQQLNDARLRKLADTLPLFGYEGLRDATAPYGPWLPSAPAGTLTDDSRHKMVLLRAIRSLDSGQSLTRQHIAQQLLDFQARPKAGDSNEIRELNEVGFREYRYAARWLLGQRDLKTARPVERLWGGVNNCSGQMMFPPLAVAYAGRPVDAYRAAFELDFIDAPSARDMLAALVAGLAEVLDESYDECGPAEKYQVIVDTMESTDPYEFRKIPFAGRQLSKWLKKARQFAEQADGRPRKLFQLLEEDGLPVYWWDAHFTLLVPLSIFRLSRFDPLAAMHLTLDFGHDTDSYAQVLGCIVGAMFGPDVFPKAIQQAVTQSLKTEYEEDIGDWHSTLAGYRQGLALR